MYWSRSLLKTNAKKVLAGSYWKVFLVCIVTGLISSFGTNYNNISMQFVISFSDLAAGDLSAAGLLNSGLVSFLAFSGIFALLLNIFVCDPLQVGLNRYLMENRAGYPPFGSLFSVFRGQQQYLNLVYVMFRYRLSIFLWSLLCLIPGIYKGYQYYYIPYLLAENPYMSFARAKELSRAMTENEKMEIFVLELSFIGWYFLGALLCGIGSLFVAPYYSATLAELYAAARAKAFDSHITGEEELAGFTHYPQTGQF